jgi:hypothetical protein
VSVRGDSAIAYTIHGDGDVTYPNKLASRRQKAQEWNNEQNINAFGTYTGNVSPVLNGAHVAATHTSSSRIAIDNNGLVLVTSRGTGLMTINTEPPPAPWM